MARGARGRPSVGRLAAEITSFVNRRTEIAELKRLLSTTRLITLTGAGGAGKTRLAAQVAHDLRRAFHDGVWQVDLTGLADGALVEYAVVDTLDLVGASELTPTQVLVEHLAERELLLFLDNCEHVLDACAALAMTILRAASGVRILCTSRQPLGVVGETVRTVAPLTTPNGNVVTVGEALTYGAMALFVERAAAVAPGFALTPDNQHSVTEICHQLDGLPLAIELAAAQLRTRSVKQLSAGLNDRFRLLAARHTVPAHHRRLDDTFEWSFALCSAAEQAVWTRTAVFAGGFELAAVGAVCTGDGLATDAVTEVVAGLVDKSIVFPGKPADPVRYRMLETVRQYGLHRLRTADGAAEESLRRRHLEWYVGLAERFDAEWFGSDQRQWAARLRAEHDNLRGALTFSLSSARDVEAGLRLSAAMWYHWLPGGALREGVHWLTAALAAGPDPTPARCRALYTYCRLLNSQGQHTAGADHARECLDLARRLGDASLEALAVHAQGLSALFGDDLSRARRLLTEAVRRFTELGRMDSIVITAQISLAGILLAQGDIDRAEQICTDAYTICVSRGELWARSQTLNYLVLVAMDRGEPARADGYARERLRIKRMLDDALGVAFTLETMAGIATANGNHRRAAQLLGAAHQARQRIGLRAFGSTRFMHWREEYVAAIATALGTAVFDDAFRRGSELTGDEAVAFALDEDVPGTRSDAVSRVAGHTPLTRREWQIAQLVAEGLSNREIASQLVISVRTAESHVQKILSKLGFSSRAQVVLWVSQQLP